MIKNQKEQQNKKKLRNHTVNKLIQWNESLDIGNHSLHMTVYIIDKFLEQIKQHSQIIFYYQQQSYELLGRACLFIIQKFNKLKNLKLKKFLKVVQVQNKTNKEFYQQKIVQLQGIVLNLLNFQVYSQTLIQILYDYLKYLPIENKRNQNSEKEEQKKIKCIYFSQYLLQLLLIKSKTHQDNFSDKLLALTALKLSCYFFLNKFHHIIEIKEKQLFKIEQINNCDKFLFGSLIRANRSKKYQVILKKYSQQKFYKVALKKLIQLPQNREKDESNKNIKYYQKNNQFKRENEQKYNCNNIISNSLIF